MITIMKLNTRGRNEDNMKLMLNTLSKTLDIYIILKYTLGIITKSMTARRDQIYTRPIIKLNNTLIKSKTDQLTEKYNYIL
jgi:hypothetical protein